MKENFEMCIRNIPCEHCRMYEKCFKKELEIERQQQKEGGASVQILRRRS